MKQFLLAAAALLLFSQFAIAQYPPIAWAKALQGKSAPYNSYCDVTEMEADAAGNLYVCGDYYDTLVPEASEPKP